MNVDAFILGAQKAGTTSLYQWLGQHPKINAPHLTKDHHFFINDDLFRKGASYFNSFYESTDATVQLHAAVNYLYFYRISSKRLYDYNPDAKLLICLRDPIERAISSYKFCVRTLKENASFKEAIRREKKNTMSEEEMADFGYLSHGIYLPQIQGFLEKFDRDQVFFVLFEELINPRKNIQIIENIFQFLNVDPTFDVNFTHLNKSGEPRSHLVNRILKKNKFLKFISQYIPFSFRRPLARKVEELNISDRKLKIDLEKGTRKELKIYYKKTIQEVQDFLDRDLSNLWGESS